ncbi:MAG TPA: tRNA adenosine(34) deaminase TadA [Candidatus Heimdallarchaeota archaeon]|nr:tRNA adenosine(34) deaminase TadA [Candidatus Heimdallarchaeota archaeon]
MTDESFMREALLEAKRAAENNEVPVGAVVVSDKKILSRAHNGTISLNDPAAHAEILAIREACRIINNYRIPGCDMYVTLEPCAMCLGAICQARIRRLIFGALDPKSGAVESIMTFPFNRMNHTVEIEAGILSEECGKILKDFFTEKR